MRFQASMFATLLAFVVILSCESGVTRWVQRPLPHALEVQRQQEKQQKQEELVHNLDVAVQTLHAHEEPHHHVEPNRDETSVGLSHRRGDDETPWLDLTRSEKLNWLQSRKDEAEVGEVDHKVSADNSEERWMAKKFGTDANSFLCDQRRDFGLVDSMLQSKKAFCVPNSGNSLAAVYGYHSWPHHFHAHMSSPGWSAIAMVVAHDVALQFIDGKPKVVVDCTEVGDELHSADNLPFQLKHVPTILQTTSSTFPAGARCDSRHIRSIDVIFVSRDSTSNFYHFHTDLLNTFMVYHMLGLRRENVVITYLDESSGAGQHFDEMFAVYSTHPLMSISEVVKKYGGTDPSQPCIRRFIFAPPAHAALDWQLRDTIVKEDLEDLRKGTDIDISSLHVGDSMDCGPSELVQAFARTILDHYSLLNAPAALGGRHVQVTVISRGKDSAVTTDRIISNEDELLRKLRQPRYSATAAAAGVSVVLVDLGKLSIHDQIATMRNTSGRWRTVMMMPCITAAFVLVVVLFCLLCYAHTRTHESSTNSIWVTHHTTAYSNYCSVGRYARRWHDAFDVLAARSGGVGNVGQSFSRECSVPPPGQSDGTPLHGVSK
eukprot:TRINITY_DN1424_c0_g1_i2.p1 TRINITY_DN1424_c0_g1~~TRINITY_DN1424_c0_g1_i2.p1  ORF type:complete len:602 (+),score=85.89 TRINITY_DN1424_c0_g1_i2:160-1965(+)